jgi:glutathione synthase/RimK-type ligase-like ATP-grasp enzyme
VTRSISAEKQDNSRQPPLLGRALLKLNYYLRTVLSVHSTHKRLPLQFFEVAVLKLGPKHIGLKDYLDQAMYSEAIFPDRKFSSLGGWWFKERVHAQLNDIRWEGMVTDKLIMYSLFEQFGLPHPKVRALAWSRARSYGDTINCRDVDSLAAFLRDPARQFPLFLKPVKGSYGRGAARVLGFDSRSDELILADGTRAALLPLLRSLEDDGWGYLVQDAVMPPVGTRHMCGSGITGCRIVMLLDDDGARPYKAVWKIPVGSNFSDNFSAGKSGNMAAAVDVASGRVIRVVSGAGVRMTVNQPHPETGFRFPGTEVPGWQDMMVLMKKAAESFPGFRWQHWDVGITDKGPVLFELNSAGNTDLVQIAYGEGIHDQQLQSFLTRHANNRPSPGKLFQDTKETAGESPDSPPFIE